MYCVALLCLQALCSGTASRTAPLSVHSACTAKRACIVVSTHCYVIPTVKLLPTHEPEFSERGIVCPIIKSPSIPSRRRLKQVSLTQQRIVPGMNRRTSQIVCIPAATRGVQPAAPRARSLAYLCVELVQAGDNPHPLSGFEWIQADGAALRLDDAVWRRLPAPAESSKKKSEEEAATSSFDG